MRRTLLRGLLAGAAGTTALNAVTYLDMAIRGRPASETPRQLVETVTHELGVDVPGDGATRDNRLGGLGPLMGTAAGLTVGVVGAVLHVGGRWVPAPLAALLLGAAAMAASDVPLQQFGVSDPRQWGAPDWAADALPHLAYGAATAAALRRLAG